MSAADMDLTCGDGFWPCEGKLEVTVLSCAPDPISVERIQLFEAGKAWVMVEFDPIRRLGRGERLRHAIHMSREAELEVRVLTRAGPEAVPAWATGRARVTNLARTAAMEACRACSGVWSRGWRGAESCNCSMRDAGKTCRGGAECEGACVFDHVEVVEKPSLRCEPDGCWEHGGTGRMVGKCSKLRWPGCGSPQVQSGVRALPIRVGPACIQ